VQIITAMKRFFLLRRRTSPRSARNKKRHGVWRRAQLRKKLNAIFRRVGPGAVKRRGVNITEVFDALDRVPDAGAVFSLRLCVALPVDGDPTASMNFSGGVKAGHTFLVVGKEGRLYNARVWLLSGDPAIGVVAAGPVPLDDPG